MSYKAQSKLTKITHCAIPLLTDMLIQDNAVNQGLNTNTIED